MLEISGRNFTQSDLLQDPQQCWDIDSPLVSGHMYEKHAFIPEQNFVNSFPAMLRFLQLNPWYAGNNFRTQKKNASVSELVLLAVKSVNRVKIRVCNEKKSDRKYTKLSKIRRLRSNTWEHKKQAVVFLNDSLHVKRSRLLSGPGEEKEKSSSVWPLNATIHTIVL